MFALEDLETLSFSPRKEQRTATFSSFFFWPLDIGSFPCSLAGRCGGIPPQSSSENNISVPLESSPPVHHKRNCDPCRFPDSSGLPLRDLRVFLLIDDARVPVQVPFDMFCWI